MSLAKPIFYREARTLHLGLSVREVANKNTQGIALSTVVCTYQLKDRKAFDLINYQSLSAQDNTAVKADLLAQRDAWVRPGESVTVDISPKNEAQYVAVARMFISPDQPEDSWRMILRREDLDPGEA